MASFNRCIIVGNVTREIELRHVGQNQIAVCDIGIAVNDRVKKGDQWVEETTWVDVTAWGRTAEVAAEYLTKGAPVLIEGKLKTETWEKDGRKHSKLKVVAESLQLLGSRKQESKPQGVPAGQTQRAMEHARSLGIDTEAPF